MVDTWEERATFLKRDPSQVVPGAPPNFGEALIPHVVTFQGILASISRVYRASDEALKDSYANARYMLNDLTVMECVEQRQRSTALLDWHLEIDDDKDLIQVALKDNLTAMLRRVPRFMQYREALLRAIWYGKYGVQHRYRWQDVDGKNRVVVDHWLPVHGDKLVFGFDDGGELAEKVGIRTGPGLATGGVASEDWREKSRNKVQPTDYGLAYFLDPWERDLLAIHKHLIEDGEFEEPVNAGRIHGLGIRSRIYWTWYQKQELLAWLMEYMERSSFGVEIWYYPWGNDQAREEMRKAAEERIGQGRTILLVPKPMGEEGMAYGVERIEPGMAGAEAAKDILTTYFGHLIKRYIIGQTLTTEAENTGLGSNLGAIQLETYVQIIKYDATNLQETVTTDLVDRLKAFNFPQFEQIPVRFVIETETPEVEAKLEAWHKAYEMGCRLKEQDVMDLIGASMPEEGDKALEQQQQQPGFGPELGGGQEAPLIPFPQREAYAKEFDESKHPRDQEGQFSEKEGAGSETPKARGQLGPGGLSRTEAIGKAMEGSTRKVMSYDQACHATFLYTGTTAADWSAVGIKEFREVDDGTGGKVSMPQFDHPKGYSPVDTIHRSDAGGGKCELCGHDIKNVYYLQNDSKKWTMGVGSECVTKFGEGKSGAKLTKDAKYQMNRDFAGEAQKLVADLRTWHREVNHNYGGTNVRSVASAIKDTDTRKAAWALIKSLGYDTGGYQTDKWMHLTDQDVAKSSMRGASKATDRRIANWVKKHGEKAREQIDKVQQYLEAQIGKYAKEWEEGKHPRDEQGQFSEKEAGKGTEGEQKTSTRASPEEIADWRKTRAEHRELHQGLSKKIRDSTAAFGKKGEAYAKAASRVFDYMTPTALRRFEANVKGFHWYPSLDHLSSAILSKERLALGHKVGGAWAQAVMDERYPEGKLHLDGGKDTKEGYSETTRGIYAHEFAHAIDGTYLYGQLPYKISNGHPWRQAWEREVVNGDWLLSRYAFTSPSEGFAEFGRLVFTSPKEARELYPDCWAVWKKEGLV